MKKKSVRIAAVFLVLLLALSPMQTSALSSSEIQSQIDSLQAQANDIAARKAELESQLAENQAEEEDLLAQKSVLDQKMTITNEEINNTVAQIEQYEQAILAKKNELADAEQAEGELYAQYKDRLRAMEEAGDVTYWAILFQANSFADLLDRLDMIQEIARADQEMMDSLAAASEKIREIQASLVENQEAMEEKQLELEEQRATLEEQSAEAQELLEEIQAEGDLLEAACQEQEASMSSLYQQIAAAQSQYETILAQEEAAQNAENNDGQQGSGTEEPSDTDDGASGTGSEETPDSGDNSSGDQTSGGDSGGQTSGGGASFIVPVSYSYISSPYGYRYHPISGTYQFHGGVDFAADMGTPVYATASGTVAVATYNQWNGNYLTIAHDGGYSSMYLHLSSYVVSYGQYVSQGQLIGYVGSTGSSTGPHLDFRILLNGSTVNPMDCF